MTDPDPWPTWHAAAVRPAVAEALAKLYADLDAAVAERGPTCWASGKCCKFDSYGHRLYVTALEVAWMLSHQPTVPPSDDTHSEGLTILSNAPSADGCPYQHAGLCTVHTIRPLGCRVFFCQRGTEAWQQDLYEDFLGRLRRVHEAHGVPYQYMEWRTGLSEAAASVAKAGG